MLKRGQELGVKLSKVQRTLSLHSRQLDSALGSGLRPDGKLVSESCHQTVHPMEGLQGWKPLKTPDSRITTNYQQMARVTEAESEGSICKLPPRPCPAGLSGQTQVLAQMATKVTRRDTSRNALDSRELAQPVKPTEASQDQTNQNIPSR